MARETIRITGIREFQKALKDMDKELPKQLRVALNAASQLVVDYAVPRVPTKTGRARRSLKVRSSQREARVAAGGRTAPYYAWLDFGGTLPRGGKRPFYTQGRFVYPGLAANRDEIQSALEVALTDLARHAGLEVT